MSYFSRQCLLLSVFLMSAFVASVNAQTVDDEMQVMRQNINLLSSTLADGLGLNERRGVFSPRAGDIRGRYLQGFGVMLEVNSNWQPSDFPIMDSFGGSLEQLSSQLDGLILQGVVQRPDFEAMRDQLALSMRTDEVAVYYREVMQQISSIQEIPAIERGLALAVSSVQTLQSMGQIDDSTSIAISKEVQSIRLDLDQQLHALSELREQIRHQAVSFETLPDQTTQERWLTLREELSLSLQALQSRMNEQSALLQNEREKAEQINRERAQRALEIFQGRLFELLCDYSAGLRGLPADESVNVVLLGAGEAMADASRRDIVFNIDRESLLSCQQGRSTPQQLQVAAIRYQY